MIQGGKGKHECEGVEVSSVVSFLQLNERAIMTSMRLGTLYFVFAGRIAKNKVLSTCLSFDMLTRSAAFPNWLN